MATKFSAFSDYVIGLFKVKYSFLNRYILFIILSTHIVADIDNI